MFDDQPLQNTGSIPSNLPIGEPDDMFSSTDPATTMGDSAMPPQPTEDVQSDIPSAPQTALDAGVLKPKASDNNPSSVTPPDMFASVDTPAQIPATPPPMSRDIPVVPPTSGQMNMSSQAGSPHMTVPPAQMGQDMPHSVTEPIGSRKTLMWIIIVVIFAVLGVGGAWAYFAIVRQNTGNFFTTPTNENTTETNVTTDVVNNTTVDTTVPPVNETNTSTQDLQNQILLGEPLDTDADGLDDVREEDLGTDPLNWDTDGDGLDDAAEVTVWKTDPLNNDTDGDGFSDGTEIKNGYSPTGPGKLFQPPTSTQQ